MDQGLGLPDDHTEELLTGRSVHSVSSGCCAGGMASQCMDDAMEKYSQDLEDYYQVKSPPVCDQKHAAFHVSKDNVLHVNRTHLNIINNGLNISCYYREIRRDPHDDFKFIKGDRIMFRQSVKVTGEFLRVRCRSGDGRILSEDALALTPLKSEVEKRCEQYKSRQKGELSEAPSIIVMVIDSISRASFRRRMPKTRHYLTEVLGGVELLGYNKVHDNTLVNIMPFFTGKFLEETEPYINRSPNYQFDDCPFIWQNLSRIGYRTMHIEDRQDIGTFNYYQKRGFKNQPVDYHVRPFHLSLEEQTEIYGAKRACTGHRPQPNFLLDYAVSFTKTFLDKPTFSWTFQSAQTHGDVNAPTWLDEINLKALQQMEKQGTFNNSILIMLSDHGFRFGYSRVTIGATIQERLPFNVIVTPKWFRSKFPHLQRSLEDNSHRLTTHFDVHATMMDVVSMVKGGERQTHTDRGQSLFTPISMDRTCLDASIGIHWCTCHDWTEIPTDSPLRITAAQAAVDHMNNKLKAANYSPPCLHLSISKIISVLTWKETGPVLFQQDLFQILPGSRDIYDKQQSCVLTVMVTIELSPNNDIYEMTMCQSAAGDFKESGYISRLTKVKKAPTCMNDEAFVLYCQCP